MDIFKLLGFAMIATVLIVVIKEQRKEIALILSVFTAIAIIAYAMTQMSGVITMLESLIEKSGISKDFMLIIFKVIGIAYLVEFGKNICMDAGQSAIATKLEMAGKVMIVVLSIPLINALLSVIAGMV